MFILFDCIWILPQVTELSASLADERETASHASEMLESESMERMRLERQMQELQVCSGRINSLSSSPLLNKRSSVERYLIMIVKSN